MIPYTVRPMNGRFTKIPERSARRLSGALPVTIPTVRSDVRCGWGVLGHRAGPVLGRPWFCLVSLLDGELHADAVGGCLEHVAVLSEALLQRVARWGERHPVTVG